MRLLCESALIGGVMLSGCSSPPEFGTASPPLTVAQVINHVVCELAQAKEHIEADRKYDFSKMVANANLYLDADEIASISPTFTYMHPLGAVTSFMFSGGIGLKQERDRLYTENFTVVMKNLPSSTAPICTEPQEGSMLTGDLGLEEILRMGAGVIDAPAPGAPPSPVKPGGPGGNTVFGQTITFTLTGSLSSVGPTWKLKHFMGPGGLFGGSRQDQHKLIISFAPVPPPTPPTTAPGAPPSLAAGAAAGSPKLLVHPLGQTLPTVVGGTAASQAQANAEGLAATAAAGNNLNMLLQSTLGHLQVAPGL